MRHDLLVDDSPDVRSVLRLVLETRFDQIEFARHRVGGAATAGRGTD